MKTTPFHNTAVLPGILGIIAVFLLIAFIRHRVLLKREEAFLKPAGLMVDLDGHRMCVYSEGSGDRTLVFLSGSGTISPILDFKNLYPLLRDDCRIAVVEKYGYGFSEQVDKPRDVASLLADTRAALRRAGIAPPYILCPHSYSGIEAIYWARTVPDEVEAIIGLDMAVPECYDYTRDGTFALPYYGLLRGLLALGIGRVVPGSVFLPSGGFLSAEERRIWIALGNRNYANIDIARECEAAKRNAALAAKAGKPRVPMLLFVSNGNGTSMPELWRAIAHRYADSLPDAAVVELDCSHYIHHFAAEKIGEEIRRWLRENARNAAGSRRA